MTAFTPSVTAGGSTPVLDQATRMVRFQETGVNVRLWVTTSDGRTESRLESIVRRGQVRCPASERLALPCTHSVSTADHQGIIVLADSAAPDSLPATRRLLSACGTHRHPGQPVWLWADRTHQLADGTIATPVSHPAWIARSRARSIQPPPIPSH